MTNLFSNYTQKIYGQIVLACLSIGNQLIFNYIYLIVKTKLVSSVRALLCVLCFVLLSLFLLVSSLSG
jgi:hypothetical protein